MLLLPFKQASQPPTRLIIVAPGINANKGGHEMLLLHKVANPAPQNNLSGNITSCENVQH